MEGQATSNERAAIAVAGLTKRFGDLVAVSQLTFSVAPGEVVGFLGPNGAGKTTTMRLLLGFLSPSEGQALVCGDSARSRPAVRGRVGYLPGDFRIDGSMTGSDLFEWFGRMRGTFDRARVHKLSERLELDPTRPFHTLSKGNRQKIGIVQALQHDPDVLLLDEPTTGLDPLMQHEFQQLVEEASTRGAAVLLSSHVLPEVERIAKRVLIIRRGQLVADTSMQKLADRARHRIELHYASEPPAGMFEGVPGVVDERRDGTRITIAVDGTMDSAMRAALSGPQLVRVGSVGDDLEDLFASLYDDSKARA